MAMLKIGFRMSVEAAVISTAGETRPRQKIKAYESHKKYYAVNSFKPNLRLCLLR